MIEIAPDIFLIKEDEMKKQLFVHYALVNVSQTYHYQAHGWKKGEDHKADPCYVTCIQNNIISLNWVDGPAKYYDYEGKGVENFKAILYFMRHALAHGRQILISCNKGVSRSPTIALLYMAKVLHSLPDDPQEARKEFTKIYKFYNPGGIWQFVSENWKNIDISTPDQTPKQLPPDVS